MKIPLDNLASAAVGAGLRAPNIPIGQLLTNEIWLAEHHLYGSSALGIRKYQELDGNKNATLPTSLSQLNQLKPWYSNAYADLVQAGQRVPWGNWERSNNFSLSHSLGKKQYSLTDHLGNLLITILDRKLGHLPVNGTHYDYWQADVATVQDVYPFGMPMAGRNLLAENYRFGFNGQQKSDEVYGKGNLNTALFWEYDTRLGRRWNLDPVDQINISNYAVSRLNPIIFTDPLGDDPMKRAWKRAQKEGLKDDQFTISKLDNGDSTLTRGHPEGGIMITTFHRSRWEKFIPWGDRVTGPRGPVEKFTYKMFNEYNPVAQAVTNTWSAVLGRDFTIPGYTDALNNDGNVSGTPLSPQRRITTGINGVTSFLSLAYGGALGTMFTFGGNAGADGMTQSPDAGMNVRNATTAVNVAYDIYLLRKDPARLLSNSFLINTTIGAIGSFTSNATGAVDAKLKEEESGAGQR